MTLTTEWLKERLKNPRSGTEFELITEVLANREAVPAAWRYRTTDINGNPNPHWSFSEEKSLLGLYQPLYTTSPAPAVPPEATPEDIPQEHNINTYSGITWAAAWNACRAAMLAQPVSSGYKLPDNVREALTLALQAMEFMGDTLNNMDAVCDEDVEHVTPAFNAVRTLLAAAPEGGQ